MADFLLAAAVVVPFASLVPCGAKDGGVTTDGAVAVRKFCAVAVGTMGCAVAPETFTTGASDAAQNEIFVPNTKLRPGSLMPEPWMR